MNFIEAMKAIYHDNKIRMSIWDKTDYLFLENELIVDNEGEFYEFDFRDYFADDWEICKERPLSSYTFSKLHTFEEAVKALKNGKTIGRKSRRERLFNRYSVGSSSNPDFKIHDVLANDWIILENEED